MALLNAGRTNMPRHEHSFLLVASFAPPHGRSVDRLEKIAVCLADIVLD